MIADPPAYTPPYDHALAAALARSGHHVELVTSRDRFGATPPPDGYRRSEVFYPLSSRLFRRSPLRVPLKLVEHPLGMAALARRRADVLHVQWLSVPELDRFLLRARSASVLTAHDILPRRTAAKRRLWRDLYSRFDAVVAHSTRGARALEALGVPASRVRVIAHPVFRSEPSRRDDGRTVLFFGVIRPYRGLGDALAAVERVPDARLIVAGDPAQPVDRLREQAGGRVEWRLGYLDEREVDRAHGEATVAVFPYRPEIDQSGSLLRALGAAVPAVVYDVGGLPEPVLAYHAGRVVPAGDVEALAAALRELLDDEVALAEARAGAERARAALTWEAAARAHAELYAELA